MNNTLPSELIFNIITTIWSEPSGRIFLLSVIYYLFSAFAVSGYMSFFAGGFGNIGSGDYSLLDFLFFLPTVAITGLTIIIDNFWRALFSLFVNFILPNLIGLILAGWLFNDPSRLNILHPFFATVTFLYISLIIWFTGIILGIRYIKFNWLPFTLQLLGTFSFGIAVVGITANNTLPAPINVAPTIVLVINLLYVLTSTAGLLLLPILIGNVIAREAVKNSYLSQITRIESTHPIFGFDQWHINPHKNTSTSFLDFLKPKQTTSTISQYAPNGDAFLIASLSKVTVIYVHKPNGESSERGKLFLISNNIISSIEIKSSKNAI